MSTPISQCLIFKSAFGDEKAYKFLLDAEDYNSTQFAYTIFPCKCDPPCQKPTEEQLSSLRKRLNDDLDKIRKERRKNLPPPGNFEKFMFPIIKNMKWNSKLAKEFLAERQKEIEGLK